MVARATPPHLRYYEHFYKKVPVFDEASILAGLTPQLHAEVVTAVLRESVGKLPLFDLLPPDFLINLFPHLKPLSFAPGGIIFEKGEASKDLFFLVEGEVLVLDDKGTPRRRICPTEEVLLGRKESSTTSGPSVPGHAAVVGDEIGRASCRERV